ncbi:MAG: hypothetical protein JWQ23_3734 [Herminiimonas sp.]|nr:hypothetical protein [Herminiimonas sp.]
MRRNYLRRYSNQTPATETVKNDHAGGTGSNVRRRRPRPSEKLAPPPIIANF